MNSVPPWQLKTILQLKCIHYFNLVTNQKLLIIGKVWPEPGSSAAGQRMLQIIDGFREAGYQITFASAASKSLYSADLKNLQIEEAGIELNSKSFDRFVAELEPNIVMFDRFMTEEQFGWRVAEQCPGAIRILDTEDLHCLRLARQKAVKKETEFTIDDLYSETAYREIASICRCDLSLIISEKEMDLLRDPFGINDNLLLYLPFLFEELSDEKITEWQEYSERSHFMTIGNFLHEPNRDAALWIKNEIWPLIRNELPGAEFHLYGAYPSQQVEQLHKPAEGFMVKGRADSSAEVISSARVMLAPLRFGAGLKGKLAEAMQYGTPSVTTTIGAEGMAEPEDWPGIVADDPESIAAAAIKLYSDKETWLAAQKSGKQIINNIFAAGPLKRKLINRVEAVLKSPDQHRRQNFTGQMLMHHTMASTKFMGRWIEAKNN